METKKNELRLTDITRYRDVEEGRLVLSAEGHRKSWKAIWLAKLNVINVSCLPRGEIPIRYKHYHEWVDCPRLRLNHQNFMWIVPLDSDNYIDMGVNLYLCDNKGFPNPLKRRDYENMVNALYSYRIDRLIVEMPVVTIEDSRFHPDNIMGLVDFWD
ncbi:MAG: hypothetical protein J6I31_00920 [Prevotella sp.]|nr:hypothetical protein [Prevotella sp.]